MALDTRVSLPDGFLNKYRLKALALIHAYETLEHPLYGVWGPFLADCVRPPLDKLDILVVTYAQALIDGTLEPIERVVMPGKATMMN